MKRMRMDALAAPRAPEVPVPDLDGAIAMGTRSVAGMAGMAGVADAEREAAIARLFDLYYTPLLRLAALLGADDPENIVAEAFYELYRKWRKLRATDSAEAYLRSVVRNLTRMRIRHLQVARRHVDEPVGFDSSAESRALLKDDQRALIAQLGRLPVRQREALVLRYWLGLSEKEIAEEMGISAGSVKTHTSRGLAALTCAMEARR